MLFSLCCWCWYSCWCCGWIVPIWRQSMHQPEDECWCNQRKMQSNVRTHSEKYHLCNVFFFKNPRELVCPLLFIAGCLFSKRYLWTITTKTGIFYAHRLRKYTNCVCKASSLIFEVTKHVVSGSWGRRRGHGTLPPDILGHQPSFLLFSAYSSFSE